jgi:hypothetical protein
VVILPDITVPNEPVFWMLMLSNTLKKKVFSTKKSLPNPKTIYVIKPTPNYQWNYTRVRGQEPKPDTLLKKNGLVIDLIPIKNAI